MDYDAWQESIKDIRERIAEVRSRLNKENANIVPRANPPKPKPKPDPVFDDFKAKLRKKNG